MFVGLSFLDFYITVYLYQFMVFMYTASPHGHNYRIFSNLIRTQFLAIS
jgi:hypothetical protein